MLDFFGKINIEEFFEFLDHVATMTKQMTILSAVESYLPTSQKMKQFKESVLFSLRQRSTFAEALRKSKAPLSDLEIVIIKTGENSGVLPEVLTEVIRMKKEVFEIRSSFLKSLRMPAITLFVAFAVFLFFCFFMFPRLEGIFAAPDIKEKIPSLTKYSFAVARFVREHTFAFFGGIVGAIWGFVSFVPIYQLPLIRTVLRYQFLYIVFKNLEFMVHIGITPQTAIWEIASSIRSEVFQEAKMALFTWIRMIAKKNISLATACTKVPFFGEEVGVFLRIGEESGDFEAAAILAAEKFRKKFYIALDRLMATLNPLIFIFVTTFVGTMLISVYMVIFSMSEAIK